MQAATAVGGGLIGDDSLEPEGAEMEEEEEEPARKVSSSKQWHTNTVCWQPGTQATVQVLMQLHMQALERKNRKE